MQQSINVPVAGSAALGRLGPINNAESVLSGFALSGALGFVDVKALRAPAAAGYVSVATTSTIVIDRPVNLLDCVCEPHRLTIVMPDGSIESRYLTAGCGTTAVGTAPGVSYLDSDPYPNTGPQPDSFTVAVDAGPTVPVGVTVNDDGSVQLHYDLSPLGLGAGTHSATVIAISTLWGDSAPVTNPFTIETPIASTLEVEVPFSDTPAVGARWILTDGVEVGSGHVISGTVSSVVLDSSVELDICGDYTLTTFAPDGTGVEAQDTITDCDDQATIVVLETNLAVAPDPGWVWTLRNAPVGFEDFAVVPLGLQAVGSVGGAGVFTDAPELQVPVFGVGLVGTVGTVTVSIPLDVTLTGLEATGAVGAVTYREDQLPAATGVSASGALGSVTVGEGTDVSVDGLSSTGTIGDAAITVDISASLIGVEAIGQSSTPGVQTEGEFPVFGSLTFGAVGDVTIRLDPNVDLSGVAASAQIGSVSVEAATDGQFEVSGAQSIGALGSSGTLIDQDVDLAGVSADGLVGTVNIGQLNIAMPMGVQAVGVLGIAIVRASTERHRVLHVARTRPRRVLRVSISSDGLPFTRT